MDETHNNRTSLAKGAKDIAKEAKRQASKNFNKAIDRATDEYSAHRSYNRFHNDEEEEDNYNSYSQQDQYNDDAANDDDGASSDATEGHDDEDEIYEGEYQGVPAYNNGKPQDGQVALGQPVSDSLKSHKELENERQADEEELAQQYELIMQECGHGRFQWQLFFVLGLALMSDGVEVFVVGFVLPSAETDMCVPNSGAGWLGKDLLKAGTSVGFYWIPQWQLPNRPVEASGLVHRFSRGRLTGSELKNVPFLQGEVQIQSRETNRLELLPHHSRLWMLDWNCHALPLPVH